MCAGFSSCGMWAQQLWLVGSRARAQQLWSMGLVAPWHVGSSGNRDRTRVPCIGRWILNHCTTREVPLSFYFIQNITLPLKQGTQHSRVWESRFSVSEYFLFWIFLAFLYLIGRWLNKRPHRELKNAYFASTEIFLGRGGSTQVQSNIEM